MWVDHQDFFTIVAHDWARVVIGPPGMVLHTKLKRLRKTLNAWNWTSFGNIFTRKKELQEQIQNLDMHLQQGWSDSTHQEWEAHRRELIQVETWENEMLCSKARLTWVKDGDRNSKYFHAIIRDRRKRQLIHLELANGETSTDLWKLVCKL